VPVYSTVVRIVGDDGQDLPAGEVGEIVTSGPMVVPGYWRKPGETEHALPGGALHTGDVGYMDAGGYKVWPRDPRQIEFLDELPKTVSGKLLRRELRARG